MKIAIIGANARLARYIREVVNADGYSRDNISYDRESIQSKIKGYDVAIIAIGLTKGDQSKMYEVNVKTLQEILMGLDVKRVMFLSSIAVYGRKNYENYDESSPVLNTSNKHDYYGWTKLLGEKMVMQYHKDYIILRIGTVFGELYDEYVKMIMMWKEKGPFYFGDGNNRVPFIYARDVAQFISKNLSSQGIVNVTSEGIRFLDVIEDVRAVFNIDKQPLPFYKYVGNIYKMSSIIGKIIEIYYKNQSDIYPLTLSRSFNISKTRQMGLEITPFKEAIKCFLSKINT